MLAEGEFSMVWNSDESTLPIQVRIRKLVDLIFDTKFWRIGDVTGNMWPSNINNNPEAKWWIKVNSIASTNLCQKTGPNRVLGEYSISPVYSVTLKYTDLLASKLALFPLVFLWYRCRNSALPTTTTTKTGIRNWGQSYNSDLKSKFKIQT